MQAVGVLVVWQAEVFRRLFNNRLDLELVLVRESREKMVLDLHLQHSRHSHQHDWISFEIARCEELVRPPITAMLKVRMQRVALVHVRQMEHQHSEEIGTEHRKHRKQPRLPPSRPREKEGQMQRHEIDKALAHGHPGNEMLVDARDDTRKAQEHLQRRLQDVQGRPLDLLAEAERVEDLVRVEVMAGDALRVWVMLCDVLEVPRLTREQHHHVEKLPRERVSHSSVNSLMTDASDAATG